MKLFKNKSVFVVIVIAMSLTHATMRSETIISHVDVSKKCPNWVTRKWSNLTNQNNPNNQLITYHFKDDDHKSIVKVHLVENGNIIKQKGVDAIVNAANESLIGAAGVAAAIQNAAGEKLIEFIEKLPADPNTNNRCEIGQVVVTPAFNLRADMNNTFIFHTVGPRGSDRNKKELLKNCYDNLLQEADTQRIKSIAIVGLSTGIFGYPKPEAAMVALNSVIDYIKNSTLHSLTDIYLLTYADDFKRYQDNFDKYVEKNNLQQKDGFIKRMFKKKKE